MATTTSVRYVGERHPVVLNAEHTTRKQGQYHARKFREAARENMAAARSARARGRLTTMRGLVYSARHCTRMARAWREVAAAMTGAR